MTKFYRSLPNNLETNQYLGELESGLKERGWEKLDFPFWKVKSLFKNRVKCTIIHMHFPEAFWREKAYIYTLVRSGYFILLIFLSKFFGYKWIFSIHNVLPHRMSFPSLEMNMRKILIYLSDNVIVFSKSEINQLKSILNVHNKRKVHLIEHGLYVPMNFSKVDCDFYFQKYFLEKNEIRIRVLTFDHKNRSNKNFDGFLDAWKKLDTKFKENIEVVIISDEPDKMIDDVSVRFVLGPVDNIDFFIYASDYVLLNYSDITTSGMFYHAKTYNKPVIMPNLGFFEEVQWENDIIFNKDMDLLQILRDFIIPQLSKLKVNDAKSNNSFTIRESAELVANIYNASIDSH